MKKLRDIGTVNRLL